MSRVEEALQRAVGADAGAIPDMVDQPDTATLARDVSFPVEAPAETPGASSTNGGDHHKEHSRANGAHGAASAADSNQTAGTIPAGKLFERFGGEVLEKVVIDDRMPPGAREQYRRLAAILHDAQNTKGLKVVMVASAVANEGKTLTAVNLALTLSGSYRKRVLLIDADLRRPTLDQVFRINTASGLADGLEAGADAKLVVRQVSPTLAVLPAGRPTSDPMAGLISGRMRQLVQEARDTFEWVLIDTPPLVLLPDANLLASMVDGVVLVVRAASTPQPLVKRATELIGRNRVLGVVLNQAHVPPHDGYYGGYHDYYLRAESKK